MNKVILDTHILIWYMAGDSTIGRKTQPFLEKAFDNQELAVSAITFWEIALLTSKDRIELDKPPIEWRKKVLDLGIHEYPVTGEIGIKSTQLEGFHTDPADRIIVATTLDLDCMLVTADKPILKWKGALETWNARK